ncbi:MAG: HNH endonuclease signature motif containing protein, partial [Nostocoides sp.]
TIVPRRWLGEVVDGRHGTVQADVIGCDPVTGGFSTDPIPIQRPDRRRPSPNLVTTAYQPTTACRAYVKARDQGCRFPGCTTSAYFTDLDHVRPWPAGPTGPDNLACLCRRHHRIKQRPGWTARLHPDGSMTWTDPTGTTRTTHPVDHLGTTLPTASQPAPPNDNVDLDDPIWGGDYWNPDAYTGGVALWLQAELDLKAAAHDTPRRRGLHPEQHSRLEQELIEAIIDHLGDPMSRNRPPDPPASDIRWRAA